MSNNKRAESDAVFSVFARACMPRLYRAAWLLCGEHQRAEDLVQDTMTKVYRHWGASIDNPTAYARTALTRTWISQQRRRSTHERPIADIPESAQAPTNDELRLTLLAALDRLTPLDRAVVVLRYFEDSSSDDVADLLGLSSNAVRQRSMRALRHLREHLDVSFEDLISNEGTYR